MIKRINIDVMTISPLVVEFLFFLAKNSKRKDNFHFFVSFSYYFSFILILGGFEIPAKTLFIETLPLVLAMKIVIFYLLGLYKGSWKYSSVEDIIKIVKALIFSSISTIFLLTLIFGIKSFGGFIFFLIDFYLSLSFVAGSRISYRIIYSFYNRNSSNKGKKVLIYGAGYKGSMLLKEIKHNGYLSYLPVGFVDDDRDKKGRIQHGYPILGSSGDLERILSKNEISEIIISTQKIRKDRLKKLTEFCKLKGIAIKQFGLKFDEVS